MERSLYIHRKCACFPGELQESKFSSLFECFAFNAGSYQVVEPRPSDTPVRGAVAAEMVIVMPAQMLFSPDWVEMSLAMLVVIQHQGCIHRAGK